MPCGISVVTRIVLSGGGGQIGTVLPFSKDANDRAFWRTAFVDPIVNSGGNVSGPTSPDTRYWLQGVADGVLGLDVAGAEAGSLFAQVRSIVELARTGGTGSIPSSFVRNVPMVAWFIVASDKIASGFGGTFDPRAAGFTVETLRGQGAISSPEAQLMIDTFACLTGQVVTLRAVTGQTGDGGLTITSVPVDTSGTVVGGQESETFSAPTLTGLETITSTITTATGETITRTRTPGLGSTLPDGVAQEIADALTGEGTAADHGMFTQLPVEEPMANAATVGAGVSAGSAALGVGLSSSVMIGLGILAVLAVVFLSRKKG